MGQDYESEEEEGAYEDEEFQIKPLTSAPQLAPIAQKVQFAAFAWSTSDSRGISRNLHVHKPTG